MIGSGLSRLERPVSRILPVGLALALGIVVAAAPLPVLFWGLGLGALVITIFIEPVGGLIVLLLLAPTKALIETERPGLLPIDIGQLMLVAAVAAWIFHRIVRHQPLRLPLSRVYLPIVLFIGAAILSIPGAWSLSTAAVELLKWIEMLVVIGLCLVLFDRHNVGWLAFAIVLAGAAQAVVGLYEFFGGSGADHLLIMDGRFFRAFGSFGQPNPFGAFMGLTLPIAATSALGYALILWKHWRHSPQDSAVTPGPLAALAAVVFYGATTILLLAALVASWSRGAWLGFAATAALMLMLIPKHWWQNVLLLVVLLVGAYSVWIGGFLPDAIAERLTGFVEELAIVEDVRGAELTTENYAVIERVAHWQAALQMAEEQPWFGVGFGNYEVAYARYSLMNWPLALGHAHNYYLNLLAEVGIVGLAAYLATWLWTAWLTLRLWWRAEGLSRLWLIGLMGVWAYLMIHSLVDKLYVNNLFIHIGCLLGLLAVLHREAQTSATTAYP